MNAFLDHIAILTKSVAETESELPADFQRHEVECFPSEGTKEQYIEPPSEALPMLLLLEAIGEGPYQRALSKRGPGLHHFGCVCDDLPAAVAYFASHRLLMHPISLETLARKTVWLCRPGIPFLVELVESDRPQPEGSSPARLAIPGLERQIDWIPVLILVPAGSEQLSLSWEDRSAVLGT